MICDQNRPTVREPHKLPLMTAAYCKRSTDTVMFCDQNRPTVREPHKLPLMTAAYCKSLREVQTVMFCDL